MTDDPVKLAQQIVNAGHPTYSDDVDVLARAVLAQHAEIERLRAGCTACRLENERILCDEADRDRLRAALKEALHEWDSWRPYSADKDRIDELRKEFGL